MFAQDDNPTEPTIRANVNNDNEMKCSRGKHVKNAKGFECAKILYTKSRESGELKLMVVDYIIDP